MTPAGRPNDGTSGQPHGAAESTQCDLASTEALLDRLGEAERAAPEPGAFEARVADSIERALCPDPISIGSAREQSRGHRLLRSSGWRSAAAIVLLGSAAMVAWVTFGNTISNNHADLSAPQLAVAEEVDLLLATLDTDFGLLGQRDPHLLELDVQLIETELDSIWAAPGVEGEASLLGEAI